MNARLSKNFVWYSGIVYHGEFLINHFEAKVDLLTVSTQHEEQNIAYERSKIWVDNICNGAIFIASTDKTLPAYQNLNARLIIMPEDPVDQVIGIMLYLKLNSIMQNRLVVTDVSIKSTQGDDMEYHHASGESLGDGLSTDGWWIDPRPVYTDFKPRAKQKIVALDRGPEWKDYGLDWDAEETKSSGVVFAKFGKDENN